MPNRKFAVGAWPNRGEPQKVNALDFANVPLAVHCLFLPSRQTGTSTEMPESFLVR